MSVPYRARPRHYGATIRAATAIKSERAAAQETGRGYYGALERLLAASRAHAHAGGALGISITSIERALQWRSKFSRALPSGAIIQRQAAALAYSLLWQSITRPLQLVVEHGTR